jgi:alpha-glucuronidase
MFRCPHANAGLGGFPMVNARTAQVLVALLLLGFARLACSEDGYDLWLRYRTLEAPQLASYRAAATQLTSDATASATLQAARAELTRGLAGLLGSGPPTTSSVTQDGAVVFGTPRTSRIIADLKLDLGSTGTEGYVIRTVTVGGHRATAIAANEDVGVLYGAFHFLRLIQTHQSLNGLSIASAPHVQHRVLNHWDNLDGSVERGYAGESLWDWFTLPDFNDPRYTDYARACASIGINGSVLTSVNASALVLTPTYLRKIAALANIFRPYGIRVYVSARFSAPVEIGGLGTADPLDPAVKAWWRTKADEIYRYVPDFGGFLVKANSEGQPGPGDYGRTQADGANVLADALAPHGGIVMWRAFVYSAEQPDDRAKQAYSEFKPLDGKFHDNVLIQVKNGAIDFQPREPFHPLFGAMPKTPVMLEVQLTKEYLGLNTNLAYLGTMWEETLSADTYAKGKGSTVRKVIDGTLHGYRQTGMAGVANIGSDRNWTGSIFDQANWYVFGRLAWDPANSARAIADEWIRMTFSNDPAFIEPVLGMMMGSRETVVDYMEPLGLHHLMARGHHYGPGPWVAGGPRADWTAVYYHRADAQGVGFDRTATGSNAVAQYSPEAAAEFASLKQIPEKFLLWFHHVPWDYRMASGRTLWDEMVLHYGRGVQNVGQMRKTWAGLSSFVDPERYGEIGTFLGIQESDAKWWRDASIAYFQTFSHKPLPEGAAPPAHSLHYYESICTPFVPGDPEHAGKCLTNVMPTSPPLVDPLFQDHGVLQRDRPVVIWGWTAPARTVTVTRVDPAGASGEAFKVAATADGTGRWAATLPPMKPGASFELDVSSDTGESQKIHDLLVGDVWLCSGQSNMALPVKQTLNSWTEIQTASNDSIRMLTVDTATSLKPSALFASPVSWLPTNSTNVPDFSATCYYFARELQKTVQVPMGLIHSSWGGSAIQTWMSEGAIRAAGGYDKPLDALNTYATDPAAGIAKWGQIWETWWREHRPQANGAEPWSTQLANTGSWRDAPQRLGYWENWGVAELANFDGLVWYRTTVTLTAKEAAQLAKLSIGMVDEVDQTWLNGRFIGTTSGAGTHRVYDVPAGLLHAGENTIVVGALDTYGFGGMWGPESERALKLADGSAKLLNGQWRYQIVSNSVGAVPRSPWEAVAGLTMAHNKMITPLEPYALKGVVWYQGESNTQDAGHYQGLLEGMMADWRQEFGAPLPFLIVQLANYGPAPTAPGESGWAQLREAQKQAVIHDRNAGLAVTIDIGDRYDIHPANKEELGRRLARAARHAVYGEKIAPSGPIPTSARRENGHVVVSFSDVEGKLVAYGSNRPLGFELCAADQASCRYADGSVDGNRVTLDVPAGAQPTRVRLCWADSPVCTLFDQAGLPAGPFEIRIE